MQITGSTTVQQVVEKTLANKGLPPDIYALYLVLGDTESQRVLSFSERLLGVMCDAGTEHFLCLRRNEFYETLEPHVSDWFVRVYVCVINCFNFMQFPTGSSSEVVAVHVREKKRWKKFPCCVKSNYFIQYKDSKVRVIVTGSLSHNATFFLFFSISSVIVKHTKLQSTSLMYLLGFSAPKWMSGTQCLIGKWLTLSIWECDLYYWYKFDDTLPIIVHRYGFWIKAMKGEDQCRYLCADKQDDMMKIIAAIIKAKVSFLQQLKWLNYYHPTVPQYPDCLQSPVLPAEMDPPPSVSCVHTRFVQSCYIMLFASQYSAYYDQ